MTRSSSALAWPARERWSGQTFWLSSGQRALLSWVLARMAKGHHTFTLDQAARAVGLDRSNVSRGLDRLASLALIGRRSTRGRNGITITWRTSRTAATAAKSARRDWPTANVATSTPFGGYLSREGFARAAREPAVRRGSARRRLSPPRLLYGRCPAGHRVRTARWTLRVDRDESGLHGSWRGWCRRCAQAVAHALELRWEPAPRATWVRAGTVARRIAADAPAPWDRWLEPDRGGVECRAAPAGTEDPTSLPAGRGPSDGGS